MSPKELLGKLQVKLQNYAYESKSRLLAFLLRVSVLHLTGTESKVSSETRKNQAAAQREAVIIWAPETHILGRSGKKSLPRSSTGIRSQNTQ